MKPTLKVIKDCFPDSDPKLIMELLRDTNAVESYSIEHNLPLTPNNPRLSRLNALNHALNMFGVEHVGQFGEKGFAYLNTGDPYYVTLRQFDNCETIFLGTVAEECERVAGKILTGMELCYNPTSCPFCIRYGFCNKSCTYALRHGKCGEENSDYSVYVIPKIKSINMSALDDFVDNYPGARK